MASNVSDVMTADIPGVESATLVKTGAELGKARNPAAFTVTRPPDAGITARRRAELLAGEPDPFTGCSNA